MSFIGDLFGSSAPATPAPVQAAPTINDAASQTAAVEADSRQAAKSGTDKAILTSGLGDSSFGASDVNRTTALGGNSSLTNTI